MTFDEFSRVVQEAFQSIPEAYRTGVEGVTTVETVETHPELPGVVTLGECLTQAYASDWQGPETIRSRVVLYYGSFRQMAQDDPDFDWDRELWETLTHELQHHLESLADEGALEAIDYAMDESFKRERDEPFDPWYFQWGEPVGEGMYRVEDEVYIERVFTAEEFDRLKEIEFQWEDQAYRIRRPEELGDIHFVVVEGTDSYIQVILIQRASWRQRLRGALRSEGPVVLESRATARRGDAGGAKGSQA
ncbi:MAG: metallopeptidase family protein [Gemmatimonadetes bacterium]|nr:metallopeptidase family protein [Gemmatimonadota bacterium]